MFNFKRWCGLADFYRWAVAGAFFANGFVTGSWALHIPLLLGRLNISEAVLGVLIFVLGCGALTAMAFCGQWLVRYGSDKATRAFAIILAPWLMVVALTSNLYLMIPVLFIFGAVIGGMDVTMNANAVAVEKHLGRALMSSSHGFWSLGAFCGGGLGSLVIVGLGAFGHAVLVTALVSLIMMITLPRLIVDLTKQTTVAGTGIRLPRDPIIYLIGLMALFAMIPEGAVLDWAALYMRQELGAEISVAGIAFAAFSATMAIVRFLGDGVRNRYGAVRTLRVSCIVAGAGLLISGAVPYILPASAALWRDWVVIASFAFAGLGIANIVPILFSAAGNQTQINTGVALSLVTLMGYSGILVAPSLIGFVAGHTGFAIVYMALACLVLVVFMLSGLVSVADHKRQ